MTKPWTVRTATAADHERVIDVLDAWWGGRSMAALLQPLFLENFSSTSLVAEDAGGDLAGFLIGLISADDPTVAYAHFVGVAPHQRGEGLGSALYEHFASVVAPRGARRIRCVTSVVNDASVAFHTAVGFQVTGRTEMRDVDGGGYVQMEKTLPAMVSPASGEVSWPPAPDAVLAGAFVEVRPTRLDDAEGLLLALDEAVVWQHLTFPRPRSVAEMARLVEGAVESMHPWTVTLRQPVNGVATGSIVGWSSYLEVSAPDARLEIGSTAYAPSVWASVVNPEAKLLLLAHAFEDLGFGRVQLKTDMRNHRSQDAIARLGAVREGVLRRYQRRLDGTSRHTVVYSITADQWPDVRQRLQARIGEYR